ncbi:MAG TPA: glycoside hydrolase family 25 protein [Chitinophagaceae bacterium]|nr:glycoside hydrolase family 25 protein [Chitinophagaceae bacterium]
MPKKKNLGWKVFILVISIASLVMLGFVVYGWWMERRAQFIRYDAFGIEIPVNYSIHGIDVSKYQDIIDWESVQQMNVDNVQIKFAFMKATEGVRNEDVYFKRNWKRAKDAGVARGAYHFFIATKSGKLQAESFIKRVKLEPGDLPPVLDVEQSYGVPAVRLRQRVKEWLDVVEEYYGVKPIIYTNVDFYKQVLKDEFDQYPLWVAHYLQRNRPRIHREWLFWQHSETGRVNGISQPVDFNVFNGDSTRFAELLVK